MFKVGHCDIEMDITKYITCLNIHQTMELQKRERLKGFGFVLTLSTHRLHVMHIKYRGLDRENLLDPIHDFMGF